VAADKQHRSRDASALEFCRNFEAKAGSRIERERDPRTAFKLVDFVSLNPGYKLRTNKSK
jgi:hypothetical protein